VAVVEPDYVVTIAAAPLVAAVPALALPAASAVNSDVNPPAAAANPGNPATADPPVEAAAQPVNPPIDVMARVKTFFDNAMLTLKTDLAATMKDNRNDLITAVQAELAANQGAPNRQGWQPPSDTSQPLPSTARPPRRPGLRRFHGHRVGPHRPP
jgi:hypothetical protein